MKNRILLAASLLLLVIGTGLAFVSQERIAVAADLLQQSAEIDPVALLSFDPIMAGADADLFADDELAASGPDMSGVPLSSEAFAMPPTETPAFESALSLGLPPGVLGAPPAKPGDAPGWPRTTAETTLAGPVANPPTSGMWVDVNISRQTVTAYRGSTPLKTVLTSTGVRRHPTVVGLFRVWAKVKSQTMSGGSRAARDYYRLPGVPNIMYFYRGFALHGTYWHRNFGHPMSHGCVNLTLDDAAYFYSFGYVGMPVRTHY
ncbi:MAG: L,D-transpeptidase [Chloroflexi bacterium]|nr:L,D-transpeptidase [Chloroflexota bacterium]